MVGQGRAGRTGPELSDEHISTGTDTVPNTHGTRIQTFLTPEDQGGGGQFGAFEAGLLIVIALGMTFMQFVGSEGTFLWLYGDQLTESARAIIKAPVDVMPLLDARDHPYYDLLCLAHWVLCCMVGYVLIPCMYLRKMGWRIRDMYLGTGALSEHFKIYAGLFILVIIPVILVSYSQEYQRIYPFTRRPVEASSTWWPGNVLRPAILWPGVSLRGVMLAGGNDGWASALSSSWLCPIACSTYEDGVRIRRGDHRRHCTGCLDKVPLDLGRCAPALARRYIDGSAVALSPGKLPTKLLP